MAGSLGARNLPQLALANVGGEPVADGAEERRRQVAEEHGVGAGHVGWAKIGPWPLKDVDLVEDDPGPVVVEPEVPLDGVRNFNRIDA